MNEAHKHTVETGYDRMAEQYLASKDPEDPLILSALEDLVPRPATAGQPSWTSAAARASRRHAAGSPQRFQVTGVDVSAEAARTRPANSFPEPPSSRRT